MFLINGPRTGVRVTVNFVVSVSEGPSEGSKALNIFCLVARFTSEMASGLLACRETFDACD